MTEWFEVSSDESGLAFNAHTSCKHLFIKES